MTATASQESVAAELGGLKAEHEVAWTGLADCVRGLGNEELSRHFERVHVSSDRYYGAIARIMKAYVEHRDAAQSAHSTPDTDKSPDEVSPDAT